MATSQLAIEVTDNYIQFTSFLEYSIQHQIAAPINWSDESVCKRQLEDCFKENSFLTVDYNDVTLSYASKESSLVPNNMFAESNAESIFKLCFGKVKEKHSIDFNRISELSIVNIYAISDFVKRFFVIKYPRIIIQHHGTHGLRKILDSETFLLKITLLFHVNYFCMTIVKHNKLEFYSFFDYQNNDDIIYHVLFALQQKELINEKGTIELIPNVYSNSINFDELEKNLKRIKELSLLEFNKKKNFIAQSQLLCV